MEKSAIVKHTQSVKAGGSENTVMPAAMFIPRSTERLQLILINTMSLNTDYGYL